jgi:dihydrofolate reductase
MTLDGVSDDPVGWDGTEHGGWALPFFDEEAIGSALEQVLASDVFLCGRRTYEGFAKYGPAITGAYSDALNGMPKLVASTTASEPLEWNASLIQGDVVERVRELKRESGGDILCYGGATLIRSLVQHDLVDEWKISLHPLVLGSGKRLFPDGVPTAGLTLGGARTMTSGVVVLGYRRDR